MGKFKATFENGGFREYYRDLERQFESFLEYVPYLSGNEETYSFRLANMILAIGAHIDSAFKEIAQYAEFSSKYPQLLKKVVRGKPENPTIKDYHVLAVEYGLPQKKVDFKHLPERESIKPFEKYKRIGGKVKTPDWWRVYNGVKHKFKKNFESANLENTRNALAAAFLLNAVHTPSALRLLKCGVLKRGASYERLDAVEVVDPIPHVIGFIKEKKRFMGSVSTPIFTYDYNQRIE